MRFEVPFGEWLPDQPDFKNPGLIEAKNVYPSPAGFAPWWGAEASAASVTGTVLGSARFERTDGTEVFCVGTSTDLFVIIGGTATASSLGLTIPITSSWKFTQFGAYIFATVKSGTGAGVYYLSDIESDTSFSAAPGSPPKAAVMARIDDFLVLGNVDDGTDYPHRVQWSKYNNPIGTWDTDIATESGYFDMPAQLGQVTGIAGGDIGIVFQKFGVSRFDYVPGGTAFQRVTISNKLGCEGHPSIVSIEGRHYYLSRGGFAVTDGANAEVISRGKVWDWFLETANTQRLNKVQGAINWDRRCIVWNFFGVDLTTYGNQIIYNWEQDSWSRAAVAVDWLVPSVFAGAFGEGEARKRHVISGFVSGTLNQYSGDTLEGILTTGDFQLDTDRRAQVHEVRPLVENASLNTKVQVGYRDHLGDVPAVTTDTAEGGLGYSALSADGRYFRAQVTLPAAAVWDKATGVQVRASLGGWT